MALSTEKVTYRGFAKLNAGGEIDSIKAKAESSSAERNEATQKKLEESGHVLFNQNEFVRYKIQTLDDFTSLVPDAEQQAYIIQAGLNYVQNAKANAAMLEVEEDNITPKYNDQTIDLRDAINEAPSKRSLSDLEKMTRLLKNSGLDDAGIANLLAQAAAAFSNQNQNQAVSTSTSDSSEEEGEEVEA